MTPVLEVVGIVMIFVSSWVFFKRGVQEGLISAAELALKRARKHMLRSDPEGAAARQEALEIVKELHAMCEKKEAA